jgi:hypothetical protein
VTAQCEQDTAHIRPGEGVAQQKCAGNPMVTW